jgi:glycerol uptake facilitator-like aquaporin
LPKLPADATDQDVLRAPVRDAESGCAAFKGPGDWPGRDAAVRLRTGLLAEGLGTAILVAAVVGSGIMAERLAGGNGAVALLCNTIPTGAILVVLVSIFAPVSGAHFNPAVTLVFAARGLFAWRAVLPYIVVQCTGGILGTIVAHLMF